VDNKLFVIGLRCGRLGNRLILFANFIAYAAEHGHRVANVTFHSYAHLFEATRRDIYCRYPRPARRSVWDALPGVAAAIRWTRMFYHAARVSSVVNERHPIFGGKVVTVREQRGLAMEYLDDPGIQDRIRDAKVVFIYGWSFRAPESVERHAAEIRSYFRPIAEHERSSDQAMDRLRQRADVIIGVHLRRGDNWKWKGGKFFFPGSRYGPWMRDLADQFPGRKAAFLVCSDEIRNEREFPGLSVGFGPGSPVGDLCALAKCDYIFGPPSTFSQWASFYGNKPLFHIEDPEVRIERDRFRVADLQKHF
jgi:hypothetical protein